MPQNVFVDTDVVISSLISKTGAANLLLTKASGKKGGSKLFISNISRKEAQKVATRLGLKKADLEIIGKNLNTVNLNESNKKLKKDFKDYVYDINDAHIVAGAKAANARFLLSYNIRDFKQEKIHKDFNLTILTPAQFLQYLRSQS